MPQTNFTRPCSITALDTRKIRCIKPKPHYTINRFDPYPQETSNRDIVFFVSGFVVALVVFAIVQIF
jgi:hypothetical protein